MRQEDKRRTKGTPYPEARRITKSTIFAPLQNGCVYAAGHMRYSGETDEYYSIQ